MNKSKSRRHGFVVLALATMAVPVIAAQLTPNSTSFISLSIAAKDCDGATDSTCTDDAQQKSEKVADQNDAATQDELPAEALATVNDLDVKLRYFKAIGFLDKSDAQRESIVAIYQEHGLAVPDKYKK